MPIPSILTQHAEEAAFLWILRDAAVRAPHYRLDDLVRLDGRVAAHVDGLRVAGDDAWPMLEDGLGTGEAGEAFAAGVIAFEGCDAGHVEAVFAAAGDSPEAARGLASALGWVEWERAWTCIERMLAAPESALRRVGLAGCALHRADPGAPLEAALADVDPALRARALAAVGELGRADLVGALKSALTDADDACRFEAARAAALLGDADAPDALATFADPASPWHQPTVTLAARAMAAPRAMEWLRGLADDPAQARAVIAGAGAVGDPAYMPWLIEQMASPGLARAAGESFAMITGVDIAYEDLDGDEPEGVEAGPSDAPEDDDVALDDDEDLAWPAPEAIAEWWQANAARFPAGTRHLAGAPVSPAQCGEVLRTGYQRQRAAAALELALAAPGKALFETRAPGVRQKTLLGPA